MKNYNMQQEILFVTDSLFFRQELYEHNLAANSKQSGKVTVDKLEEACWNGMLRNWLPGVIQNTDNKELFFWKIVVAKAFLYGALSEAPAKTERRHSLNPHFFFPLIINN
jgi:hypothetical protein